MRLLHLANFHSANIGNGALIYGTERVLNEDCADDWDYPTFTHEPWDDYTFGLIPFDARFVDKVNAHDALLVNGAVTFNGRPYLSNTGMRLDLPLELWPKIKKPIVFYGASYRVWPSQPYFHSDQLARVMEHILNHPKILFAVRNDGTKEWLESLIGHESSRIEVIPDPGIFVRTTPCQHPELSKNQLNVIIALNNEDAEYRYHEKPPRLTQLASVITQLTKEFNLNLVLAPHYLDDYVLMGEFVKLLPPQIAHQHVVTTGMKRVQHAAGFYDLYREVDFVLAMRVHALSPSIGLGTPVIALSTQSRIDRFLEDMGLQDCGVDFFSPHLEDEIWSRFGQRRQMPGRFWDATQAARARLREFNGRVFSLLN